MTVLVAGQAIPASITGFLSALLLLVIAIAVIAAAWSLFTALADVAVYIGGAAILVGGIFYFVDGLSLDSAMEFVEEVFGLLLTIL